MIDISSFILITTFQLIIKGDKSRLFCYLLVFTLVFLRLSTHFSIVLSCPYKSYYLPCMSSIHFTRFISTAHGIYWFFGHSFSHLLLMMHLFKVETSYIEFRISSIKFVQRIWNVFN